MAASVPHLLHRLAIPTFLCVGRSHSWNTLPAARSSGMKRDGLECDPLGEIRVWNYRLICAGRARTFMVRSVGCERSIRANRRRREVAPPEPRSSFRNESSGQDLAAVVAWMKTSRLHCRRLTPCPPVAPEPPAPDPAPAPEAPAPAPAANLLRPMPQRQPQSAAALTSAYADEPTSPEMIRLAINGIRPMAKRVENADQSEQWLNRAARKETLQKSLNHNRSTRLNWMAVIREPKIA